MTRINELLSEIGTQVAKINNMSSGEIAESIVSTESPTYWGTLISKQAQLIGALQEGDIETLNEKLKTAKANEEYYKEKWFAQISKNNELIECIRHLSAALN